MFIPFIFIR